METLKQKLKAIDKEIFLTAIRNNLSTDKIEPITDGVGDENLFLSSDLNTTWVMREPYDDKDENGKPLGGGWSLPKDLFMKETKWKIPTWQRVIYVMYGLKHNLYYNDMDWIRNDPEMGNVLREIPWINVSKMPALTTSQNNLWKTNYNIWKEIIRQQIDVFNTRVVVFAGTFDVCRKDYITEGSEPIEEIQNQWVQIRVYKEGNRIYLDVPHPGFRRKVEPYVNSIIDILRKYK